MEKMLYPNERGSAETNAVSKQTGQYGNNAVCKQRTAVCAARDSSNKGKTGGWNMTFTYPAVITPHKDDDGFHIVFPDLELCEGDGPDLEDALDDAREAAYNWLMLELEEGGEFPAQSHEEDIEVPEGGFVRRIIVRIKLLPDSD